MANQAGAVNLGDLNFDDLDDEQKQKLQDAAKQYDIPVPTDQPDARTAFVVIVQEDGNVGVSTKVPGISVLREATPTDITSALHVTLDFFTAQQTAQAVQGAMMQQAMAMKQQAENDNIKRSLKL